MSSALNHYESDGTRLAYVHSGSGVPVVFLHPTPFDHQYWLPLVSRLHGVHAIVPDLRGHGASELGSGLAMGGFAAVPDAPVLTMECLATDVFALLDRLQIEEALFVGCSIGGYVLLELWRQAPERVRGLAFICSKAQPDAEANVARRAATIALARSGNRDEIFDGMAQSLIGASSRQKNPQIVTELRQTMTVTAEGLVAVQAGLATRPDSLSTVETIEAPVLAIAGGEDSGVTPQDMQAFFAAPGGCEFHLLADAGHLAAYEQPEKMAALLAPWLEGFREETVA